MKEIIEQLASEAKPSFLHGLKEFRPGKTLVPYSGPWFDKKEIEMALTAFLTGAWLTSGTYVYRFQNMFSKIFDVKHSHMVNSGSSANLVMLAALKKFHNWKDNAEIIVSPVGFPTTVAPIVQNNLKPVFADIEFDTLNFDLDKVLLKITPNTVGIFVSPVLGNPPNMSRLQLISQQFGIILIGDNCDSLGSKWDDELITKFYEAWSCSFYAAHHICTGEGGIICSDNEELISLARSFSWWGRACYCVGQANLLACGTCNKRFSKWLESDGVDAVMDHKYVFENMGYNLKPLDLQGAIGLAQLGKWERVESLRRAHFTRISNAVSAHNKVHVASKIPNSDPSWFGVPIICNSNEIRQSFMDHLEKNKIQCRPYFSGNLLRHPGYKHLDNANDYPNADKALNNVFFLGCWPGYTEEVLQYIEGVIESWKD